MAKKDSWLPGKIDRDCNPTPPFTPFIHIRTPLRNRFLKRRTQDCVLAFMTILVKDAGKGYPCPL